MLELSCWSWLTLHHTSRVMHFASDTMHGMAPVQQHLLGCHTNHGCFETGLPAGTALLKHACMLCRRADIVAAQYVAATEGTLSPELPFEPISLRLRHRHGSHEALPPDDSWTQLQLEAEMLNL